MAVDPTAIEQVHAAWASAYASIAQAVSGVVAIGVSLWISISSDQRARKAEEHAARRIKEADERAEMRVQVAQNEEYNRPLKLLIARLEEAIGEANANLADRRKTFSGQSVSLSGGAESKSLSALVSEYNYLIKQMPCPRSFKAVSRLTAFPPINIAMNSRIAEQYFVHAQNEIDELCSIRDELKASLRQPSLTG